MVLRVRVLSGARSWKAKKERAWSPQRGEDEAPVILERPRWSQDKMWPILFVLLASQAYKNGHTGTWRRSDERSQAARRGELNKRP